MRLSCVKSESLNLTCFNPRICKRCDVELDASMARIYIVSIHASVKDATNFYLPIGQLGVVSIHASVKDATHNPGG